MTMMEQLAEWWPLIVSLAACIGIVLYKYEQYRKADKEEQEAMEEDAINATMAEVRKWLLKAVTDAEAAYGGGTGKLKIREVYEHMLDVFGQDLRQIITLEQLDAMAQAPLAQMRKLLETNTDIRHIVETGGVY